MSDFRNKEFTPEEAYFFYRMCCALQGALFGGIVSVYHQMPDKEFEAGVNEQIKMMDSTLFNEVLKDFDEEEIAEALEDLDERLEQLLAIKFRLKDEMCKRHALLQNADLKEVANASVSLAKKLAKETREMEECPICLETHPGRPCQRKQE